MGTIEKCWSNFKCHARTCFRLVGWGLYRHYMDLCSRAPKPRNVSRISEWEITFY